MPLRSLTPLESHIPPINTGLVKSVLIYVNYQVESEINQVTLCKGLLIRFIKIIL